MDFALDLLQGVGIAAAIGIRPFLPVLLAGALASANVGLDFDGTSFAFLESPGFLLGVFVLVALADFAQRRRARTSTPARSSGCCWRVAVVLGALVAAGSLADHDYAVAPGIVGGAAAATLGFFAARSLFTRVRRRLDPEAQGALPIYGEGAALGAAGAVDPLPAARAILVRRAACAWLLGGGRRRAGREVRRASASCRLERQQRPRPSPRSSSSSSSTR